MFYSLLWNWAHLSTWIVNIMKSWSPIIRFTNLNLVCITWLHSWVITPSFYTSWSNNKQGCYQRWEIMLISHIWAIHLRTLFGGFLEIDTSTRVLTYGNLIYLVPTIIIFWIPFVFAFIWLLLICQFLLFSASIRTKLILPTKLNLRQFLPMITIAHS